jgi:hypothetical protein
MVVKKKPEAKPVKEKKAAFKIPKTLAECADLLYEIKAKRAAKQKEADEFKKQESELNEHLINNLPKGKATGVVGRLAKAIIDTEDVPTVADWDKLYAYIAKNKAFDLLQRRVSSTAVEERWEAKKEVPGIKKFKRVFVSLTKK